jgi:biopolymer transport protein TolR
MSQHEADRLLRQDSQLLSEINVTPFIDIMLVLLIIFMVTAPLMLGGVNVNLPKSQLPQMPRPDTPLIVTLDARGQLFIGEQPVADDTRRAQLSELARQSDSGEVYLRGDGDLKYARIMMLMSELGLAGFSRVTLVSVTTSADTATRTR